ncbi:MAG: hypothetical protein DYG99_06805 [Bacteroidetes bacterium CHB5]|nr:hypothetical protein [Bacteroidetes bacterium CHB5]
MRGFSVGIKSIFLISFGNGGQFGDCRAKHSATLHFLALLFPATAYALNVVRLLFLDKFSFELTKI